MLTNSLALIEPTLDPLGCCFDPLLSRVNHSCDPNAVVLMDGPKVFLRSVRPIATDEEILSTYVESSEPFRRRQSKLEQQYFFECKCPKCRKGQTSREDSWLQEPSNLPEEWAMAADQLLKQDTSYGKDKRSIVETPGDEQASRRMTVLQSFAFSDVAGEEKYERLRVCAFSKMWPLHRQPWPTIRHGMITDFIEAGNYQMAFVLGLNQYFHVDPMVYLEPIHAVRVVHTWMLVKLAVYLGDPQDNPSFNAMTLLDMDLDLGALCYGLLFEVCENVTKSHGKDSSFARTVKLKFEELKTDMTRGDPNMLRALTDRLDHTFRSFKMFAALAEESWLFEQVKHSGKNEIIQTAVSKGASGLHESLHKELFGSMRLDRNSAFDYAQLVATLSRGV